jgi:peptidylprolyl isomerase
MLRRPRLAASCAVALVLLTACGREPAGNTAATGPGATVTATSSTSTPATGAGATSTAPTAPGSTEDGGTTAATDSDETTAEQPATTTVAEPTATLEKPEVSIPEEIPTELVVTDLEEGSGPEAESGDTVLVHYVGVRSEDGAEFDNSFDGGQPFPVVLGAGGVIEGWDEGLVGVRAGGRRQLDIPAELAYGDQPRGDVIRANDALTFVIDAVAVIAASDPADAPDSSIAPAQDVDELVVEDLVTGEGEEIEEGRTAVLNVALFAADTGEQLYSSWENGQTEQIPYPNDADILQGLIDGLDGMKTGGRRQLTIPSDLAYGPNGNPDLGLAPGTDLVIVVEFLAQF